MDAVKYIREKARMCNSFNLCDECPLYGIKSTGPICGGDRPEESVSIVEQWSREHPAVTNAQKFKEVFGKDALDILELNCELDIWLDQPYKEPEVTRRENP